MPGKMFSCVYNPEGEKEFPVGSAKGNTGQSFCVPSHTNTTYCMLHYEVSHAVNIVHLWTGAID